MFVELIGYDLSVKFDSMSLILNNNGIVYDLGNNKQLFWRTADRAERFGRL